MSPTDLVSVFVALFAITNVLPVLPVALSILEGVPQPERSLVTRRALLTVLAVGTAITLAGSTMLRWWGLTTDDLRLAGGVVLLVFAIHDLLFSRIERKTRAKELDASIDDELARTATNAAGRERVSTRSESDAEQELAVVPLGVPILLGPAGMTALLVFGQTRGVLPTLAAFLANFAINAALLFHAGFVRRVFGRAVVRATGKVMSLVLAALAISMLRRGIENVIAGAG